MSALSKKLARGWSQQQIRMIRIRPGEAQEKATEDSKSMREAAKLLEASSQAIRGIIRDGSTFGDREAAMELLRILEQ